MGAVMRQNEKKIIIMLKINKKVRRRKKREGKDAMKDKTF